MSDLRHGYNALSKPYLYLVRDNQGSNQAAVAPSPSAGGAWKVEPSTGTVIFSAFEKYVKTNAPEPESSIPVDQHTSSFSVSLGALFRFFSKFVELRAERRMRRKAGVWLAGLSKRDLRDIGVEYQCIADDQGANPIMLHRQSQYDRRSVRFL